VVTNVVVMNVVKKGHSKRNVVELLDDDTLHIILTHIPYSIRGYAAQTCRQFHRVCKLVLGDDLNLVPEQVHCFLHAMAGENVFITGAAGCGKSHVLKTIIKHLPSDGLAVTASTGCAAAIIGASTFHSTCALGLGKAPAKIIVKRIVEENPNAYRRLRSLKTLVVDEVGMLTGRLFDKAGDVVGQVRRQYTRTYNGAMANAHATSPFDTAQLILCGDALQLPPVGVEEDGWIFESKCWNDLDLRIHELKHVHRQQDTEFIKVLQRMRVGKSTMSDLNHLMSNSASEPMQGALKLFAVNAPADHENELNLAKLPGRAHRFNAVDSASSPNVHESCLQDMLRHCPAPKLLIIVEGARVMCLKNINDNLVNGSLGTVKSVFPTYNEDQRLTQVNVTVEFDGQLGAGTFLHTFSTHIAGREVDPANHFTICGQDNKKLAQRIQLPLRLAWAISIHKSQGACG